MESIINLLKLLGAPVSIIVVAYIANMIWKSDILTVISSSDIEWLFLSQEKRIIYKILHWIFIFILTFVLLLFVLVLLASYTSIINFIISIGALLNILIVIMFLSSLIMLLLRDKKWVNSIRTYIGRHNTAQDIVIMILYYIPTLQMINICIPIIYSENQVELNQKVIINFLIISIVVPIIAFYFMRIWINVDRNQFYFVDDGKSWYIIKLHEIGMLTGNKPIEEECSSFKFVDLSELKNKVIQVQKPDSENRENFDGHVKGSDKPIKKNK